MTSEQSATRRRLERMDDLVSLCARRGFIFPSSEIYGGINGFWDYGPLGTELKNNLKALWWQRVVRERPDVEGIDSAIIAHPRTWEASGHVEHFSDPMVDCRACKKRFRADQLADAGHRVGQVDEDPLGATAIEGRVGEVEGLRVALDELHRQVGGGGALAGLGDHVGAEVDADDLSPRGDHRGDLARVGSGARADVEDGEAVLRLEQARDHLLDVILVVDRGTCVEKSNVVLGSAYDRVERARPVRWLHAPRLGSSSPPVAGRESSLPLRASDQP